MWNKMCYAILLLLTLSFSGGGARAGDATLVGWWPLDGDTLDYSGYGNHGTVVGSPTFVAGIIGTGGQARFAADAKIMIDQNNAAKIMHMTGAGRTAMDTGWIAAVVAALCADLHVRRRKFTLGFGGNPIPIKALRHFVLGLAGDHAVHAADTFLRIYDHRKPCHPTPPAQR